MKKWWKKILLFRNFTYNNSLLKNEARTQKYFSNMAFEQKILATPVLDRYEGVLAFYLRNLILREFFRQK